MIGNGKDTGAKQEPHGILTAVNDNAYQSNQTVTGVSRKTAFGGSSIAAGKFNIEELLKLYEKLDNTHANNPNLRALMRLGTLTRIMGVRDADGQTIFWSTQGMPSLPRNILNWPVTTDQNMPNMAEGTGAILSLILGDFSGFAVRYCGGVRIDFSMYERFLTDDLVYRFIQHADCEQIDNTKIVGYKFAA